MAICEVEQNRHKQALAAEYNCLDFFSESNPPSPNTNRRIKKLHGTWKISVGKKKSRPDRDPGRETY